MHPTHEIETFVNISSPFVLWLSFDLHAKFLRRSSQGTPPPGTLNAKGVAKKRAMSRSGISSPDDFLVVIKQS